MYANDAAVGTGMTFLVGELEKQDPRLLEPLQSVTWPRDIVARTGGGFVDYTSNVFVDYATTGGANGSGIIGGETNDIATMQANITKDVWKVFEFANILKIPFIDQQKLQNVGRSLNDIMDSGIRLNYNKSIDNITYLGVPTVGVTGLVNDPDVVTTTAAAVGTGNGTQWSTKTPQQILNDINAIITSTWEASEYDLTGMSNHILVPPVQFASLMNPVTTAGSQSILEYLLNNNIGRSQGIDVQIVPARWCNGAGAGGTDRMVAYVNLENRVNFDLPVPLNRALTQVSVEQFAYLTGYVAQIGQVKILYYQTIAYVDGI
jgi:hypothetical protein